MEYALVDRLRTLPKPGLKGICPLCKNEVIAKCGKIKFHHWAHLHLPDCDTWSEPETLWHRQWKNKFPENYREVPFTDPINNEVHRADVHTPNGVTLEFQHSPISISELTSRNNFYKKLIWVVDGTRYAKNIEFTCNIPDPTSPLLDNFSISGKGKYSMNVPENLMFFRKPAHEKDWDADRVLTFREPELLAVRKMMESSTPVFWMFDWKWQNQAWLDCNVPVFLDFGGEDLYWLKLKIQHRSPRALYYLQIVLKEKFIAKYTV